LRHSTSVLSRYRLERRNFNFERGFISHRSRPLFAGHCQTGRNYQIDREALAAALTQTGAGYVGMIFSKRKVRDVFDDLRRRGVPDEKLATVYAPLGLDIGADSPAEIAVSTIAEVLSVLRQRTAKNLLPGG